MLPNFFRRVINFEFWPWQLFYFPLYPYLLYLSVKYKNAFAFSAINSSISKDSGLFNASKNLILKDIENEYKPKELLLDRTQDDSILSKLESIGIKFPMICKPNFGERGINVEKIVDNVSLDKYLNDVPGPIVIQEFIDLAEEYAIVFFKHPMTGVIDITSIGQKEFLKVKGDGISSVKELLNKDSRGNLYTKTIIEKYPNKINFVVPEGDIFLVEPIGNHCRGTKFVDRNDLLGNVDLLSKICNVLLPLKGFHFGRIDLKTESEETLIQEDGEIIVFEINGVHAEPSHIYDPGTSIFKAYKDLYQQWDKIYSYGNMCAKQGIPCLSLGKFISLIYHKTKEPNDH